MCERCWKSATPRERLPYYRDLFDHWKAPGIVQIHPEWWTLRRAVMAGG